MSDRLQGWDQVAWVHNLSFICQWRVFITQTNVRYDQKTREMGSISGAHLQERRILNPHRAA
jgi:hypothetical protein